MEPEQKRIRRTFTPEFKAEAVRQCRAGDRTIGQVARDLDVNPSALKDWVRIADSAPGASSANTNASSALPGALTNTERDELKDEIDKLRRENKRLREERDLLKATVMFFAKECDY